MRDRIPSFVAVVLLGCTTVLAEGRVLNGEIVPINNAQNWCVSPKEPLPNWDTPAHPDCRMVWRVIAERDGRMLYSARYAWPSQVRSKEPLRVMTEVLYEGLRGSRVVRRLYAVQEDEAYVRLEPLRVLTIGGADVIQTRVCLTGTDECGHELAAWTDGRVEMIEDHTVAEIRSRLPEGYDLRLSPAIDLASLSGSGKAWARRDAECCPSAEIEFTLRLDGRELHVEELRLSRRPR